MPVRKRDDTSCSIAEESWFDASEHMTEMIEHCKGWQGRQWLEILEVFSFSAGIAKCKSVKTYVNFDIRTDGKRHDLTTRRGVYLLLSLGMSLVSGALVTAAPPCSLFVWLSSSVHRRNKGPYGPYGDVRRYKVRLANLIVKNFVLWSVVQAYFVLSLFFWLHNVFPQTVYCWCSILEKSWPH